MSTNPSSIANPFLPVVDGKYLKQIILHQGFKFMLYRKGTKCPDGWIEGMHDRDCTTCNSASGYIYTAKPINGAIFWKDAHAMYNVENVKTAVGDLERADAFLWVEFHTGRIMKEDDVIVFTRGYGLDPIEFIVMRKLPLMGTKGRIAGWNTILFKPPVVDVVDKVTHRRI